MFWLSALFMAFCRMLLALVTRHHDFALLSLAEQTTLRALDFYTQRTEQLRGAVAEAVRLQNFYRISVVVLICLACLLLYESFVAHRFPVWSVIIAVPPLVFVMRQARNYQNKALKLFRLSDYYGAGIARLTHEWSSLDEGRDFIDQGHLYATDLDLFGHGSLFQLICSARTQTGRAALATWLKAPASREEVLARHAAVAELRGRHDLCEALAAAGAVKTSDCRPETFQTWVAEASSPLPSWVRLVAVILAISTVAAPILFLCNQMTLLTMWCAVAALLLAESAFAAIFLRRVRRVLESIGGPMVELSIVCEMLDIMNQEHFVSIKLRALVERAKDGAIHARRLRRLMKLATERDNPWFTFISFLLLWGTQFTIAIELWRHRYGKQLLDWLAALGEFEALVSLATYSYEHPFDTFPELSEEGRLIDAEGVGHPLIDEGACVRNDLRLGGDVHFLIISGSNMSGKSTFLRAIGLNAVLAWMGAPVRCTKLKLSALAVGAAVRVQDSLVDGRSHFLAEIQRLRRMIDAASEMPLLYLADEIMSGTNSHDRRIATEWVIRALVLRDALGVITTHDLALTEIASSDLPGANAHFEDSGESGSLHFDYKLREGLLTHSNALNIAHMLGLDAAASS
jgi:MutS-like protein